MNIRGLFRFRRDAFVLTLYILISVIMLGFSSGGFVTGFSKIGFSMMSGVGRGMYSVVSFFTGTVAAIRELTVLRQKYEQLVSRMSDYELLQRSNAEIRKENDRLRELLGFTETLETRNIAAEIIGRDPNNLYSGITINRGSRHGIRKNMPVVSFQGGDTGLVGRIIEVGRSTSMIMPVYDLQCFVAVRLEHSRYDGLVNGQGSPENPLIMRYVKKRAREEISIGERILTSGENVHYPGNIAVGVVSRISGLDYEPSLEIDIEPLIDFSRLETVFVLDVLNSQGNE